ncbi:MAG: ABC transporter ATP-binding protein [Thermotogae bacterium]|nr:ABC transporter ATP-binding protein [Thermotogota bacterium]
MTEKVLEVKNLKTYFRTMEGTVKAVDGVSFDLYEGEILALVGESGCGKSITNMTIMGLVKSPPAIIEGEILYNGKNILELSKEDYRKLRGKEIGMIFQEPMSAFDPLYTIGYQLFEVCKTHLGLNKKDAKPKIIEMLKKVGIPEPEKRFDEYPHEMSGGMLQRIMIAMTLITNPKILIADEPTTALDVTIQAQVLNLMKNLQKEFNTSIIFITHDLGVVSELADRVHVMYAGKIIEKSDVYGIYETPEHPYTKGLLASRVIKEYKDRELPHIPGFVPKATNFPDGCRFAERCSFCTEKCQKVSPELIKTSEIHETACFLYGEDTNEKDN